MESGIGFGGNLVLFLVILNGLVFVHELGHYLAARSVGVFVEEFAVGFPPRLFGFARDLQGKFHFFLGNNVPSKETLGGDKTIYSVNLLPIGGFVRPRGEDDPRAVDGLATASKRARFWILFAGPFFNLVLAFLIFVVAFRMASTAVAVAGVAEGSPAATAGLQAGDIVREIGGRTVNYSLELQDYVAANRGREITLEVEREGKRIVVQLTPRLPADTPANQGAMGVQLTSDLPIGPGYDWPGAVIRAGQEMYFQFEQIVTLPGRLIRGQIDAGLARPIGPVGMFQVTEEIVNVANERNTWFPLVQYVGMISIALGITNLLPLPALDGGRIVFVLIEAIRGRRMDPAREGLVHLAGLVGLLGLMVFITYLDITNPIFQR